MSSLNSKFLICLTLITIVVSGCGIKIGQKEVPNDGGIYKSADSGETWANKVALPVLGPETLSLVGVDVNDLTLDPQDHLTLYLATNDSGLFYSYDGGETWQAPRSQPVEMKSLKSVAVDPKDSCTIYVAAARRIYKSANCARTWQEIYFTTRQTENIKALAVDSYDTNVVYAGTSEGTMLKSLDFGLSWQTINKINTPIQKIVVDKKDTRVVYFASLDQGLFKTTDKGATWQTIGPEQLKNYKNATQFKDLVQDVTSPQTYYLASAYGLLKTSDGGNSWQEIKLNTQPNQADLRAVAIDPANNKNIYYSTNTTFYASHDAGQNWIAQKLPTSRAAVKLLVDMVDTGVIYMGVRQANINL